MPRPFVTCNFAITWDGRVSTRAKTPADFSSKRDKRRLLEIRATGDAILAGAKTIAADNMSMGLPAEDLRAARKARGKSEFPLRVLLTNSGRLSPALKVFAHDFSPIVIFSTKKTPRATRDALGSKATLHLHDAPRVDLAAMLETLHRDYKVGRLVCEGGPQVFRSLLTAGLVDELHVTFCPLIFGGEKAATLTGIAGDFLPASAQLQLRDMEVIGGECFARYKIAR